MAEQINLNKTAYAKTQYKRVIDTSFTQLVEPTPVSPLSIPSISVADFFINYQEIFYQIPKLGDINSHEYLIKTSQAYIGSSQADNDTIQALIDEITQLRQENVDLQQQLISTQTTGNII
jgi:hypothetical protein